MPHERHSVSPLSFEASHLTERKIAFGLRFKFVLLKCILYLISKCHTKSCNMSKILCMQHEVREQEIQTISHTLHICFCQYTKNTYQANRAFMQGITIHEACTERDTAYMLASMHTLALWAFTLQAVVVFLLLGDGASSSDGPREAPQSASPVQYLWGLAMFNSAPLMSGLCLTCADASQRYAWWVRRSVVSEQNPYAFK